MYRLFIPSWKPNLKNLDNFAFLHLLLVGVGRFPTQDVLFVVVTMDNLLQRTTLHFGF